MGMGMENGEWMEGCSLCLLGVWQRVFVCVWGYLSNCANTCAEKNRKVWDWDITV